MATTGFIRAAIVAGIIPESTPTTTQMEIAKLNVANEI